MYKMYDKRKQIFLVSKYMLKEKNIHYLFENEYVLQMYTPHAVKR